MKKLFLAFSFWLLAAGLTHAATIGFVIPDNRVVMDEELKVELVLKTESENVNALEGGIVWPSDKLELIGVQDNFSVVSLWIKDPNKLATSTLGQLPFSGLIPSGYGEPRGQILTLIFRPLVSGPASITVKDGLILLNDGKGTPAETIIEPLNFKIRSTRGINQLWGYLFFLIVGIIIVILLWRIIRRRKSFAV